MKKAIFVLAMILASTITFAQTEADFTVGLTDDGTGVVIKGYTGKVLQVNIPATIQGMPVKEIGRNAFQLYSSTKITAVTIPDSVIIIGDSAFSDCDRLTSIRLPAGLTKIGSEAFSHCSALNTLTIPANVTSIGAWAFKGSGLTSLTWPASVPRIPTGVAESCSKLTTLVLPEGLILIGEEAFSGCSSLNTITIPDSAESLPFAGAGADQFAYCSKLPLATQARLKKLGYAGYF
jgi:hypothetical protein